MTSKTKENRTMNRPTKPSMCYDDIEVNDEKYRYHISGETIQIKASKKVRFLPAKALKETVSGARKLGPAPKPVVVAKPVAKKAAKKVAKKATKKVAKKAKAKKGKKR